MEDKTRFKFWKRRGLTLHKWKSIKQQFDTLGLDIERSHFSAVALVWLVMRKAEQLLISKIGVLIIPIDIGFLLPMHYLFPLMLIFIFVIISIVDTEIID